MAVCIQDVVQLAHNLKEREHSEDLGVYVRIILERILGK
jgi:hypothetical protein